MNDQTTMNLAASNQIRTYINDSYDTMDAEGKLNMAAQLINHAQMMIIGAADQNESTTAALVRKNDGSLEMAKRRIRKMRVQ